MESQCDVIRALLGKDGKRELVAHQIDSFDDFVQNRITDVVEGFNPIKLNSSWQDAQSEYTLASSLIVKNPKLVRPSAVEHDGTTRPMTPDIARARHFTYAGDLVADITVLVQTTCDGKEQAEFQRSFTSTNIGRIPIMVYSSACAYADPASRTRSNMCPHDPGGYFIIGGNERVIVPQDRMSENRIFVFPVNKTVSYTYAAEVRSLVSEKFGVPKLVVVKASSKPNVAGHFAHVTMHHVTAHIPLFIMMRALGAQSDREMFMAMAGSHMHGQAVCRFLSGCAHDAGTHGVFSAGQATAWIAAHCTVARQEAQNGSIELMVKSLLETELLPHVGRSYPRKIAILADMARRVALVSQGILKSDDRDSYINKRIDPTGILLSNLFRQSFGKFAKEVRRALARDLATRVRVAHKDLADEVHMASIARPSIIENSMRTALATGNWGVKNNAKVGVSQVLSRMTYAATMSHLRRVTTSIDKTSKLVHPRKLHTSQWGVFCPAETPEGHSVGVVKNLSIGARVTLPVDPRLCIDLLKSGACGPISDSTDILQSTSGVIVSVNYSPVGRTNSPRDIIRNLRSMRRGGILHAYTSIVFDSNHREVRVLMDGGRLVRPLMVVHAGRIEALQRSCEAWASLLLSGDVEYLDIEEACSSLVAMRPEDVTAQHSHCEIHPAMALGILATMIPFPDHNQSPRNSYQSAMGKQAIGVHATNFRHRYDTHAMVLDYAQRPIVSGAIAEMLRLDDLPHGVNLIVAVATASGYNQEDSVVLNRSSLERGLFATTVHHTIYEQIQRNPVTGEEEMFYAPDASDMPLSTFDFSKLSSSGFPPLETPLQGGDVVIGKCMPQKEGGYADDSVALRTNESGKLDAIVSSLTHGQSAVNGDGYAFCQVRLRDSRQPTIGDKVASRAGQKGTVGMVLRQEDMPVTSTGLVPDLIINPHALPSRMTVGQLLEGVLGKACCSSGSTGNATPFGSRNCAAEVFSALARSGAECHGEEVVHDPRSGRQMQATMFISPTFYQRLKHQVIDKVHGRGGSGPMVMLTRQPAEGRARDGGLRLGEMEIECLLSHGQMKFLKERFMTCSDGFMVYVCRICGAMAHVNPEGKVNFCSACQNTRSFRRMAMPYAMKLMLQEVQGMGMSTLLLGE